MTVQGHLARDGTKLANMQTATLADGRQVLGGRQDQVPTRSRREDVDADARGLVLISVLLSAGPAWPQSQTPPAPPDLSGFWINQYTPDLSVALGKQPPFTAFGRRALEDG